MSTLVPKSVANSAMPTPGRIVMAFEHDAGSLKKAMVASAAMTALGSLFMLLAILLGISGRDGWWELLLPALGIALMGLWLLLTAQRKLVDPFYLSVDESGLVTWRPLYRQRQVRFEKGVLPSVERNRLIWRAQPHEGKLPALYDGRTYIDLPSSARIIDIEQARSSN